MRIRALLALVVLDTALSPWDLAGQLGSPSSVAGRWDVMAESPPATASWPTAGTLTIDQAGDSLRAILEWIPRPTVSLAGSRSQSELLLVGPWTNDMVVDGVRVRARTQLSGTIHPDGSLQGEIALAREDNGRLSFRRAWSARRSAEGEPSSPQTAEHPTTGAPPVAIAAAESLEARFQRALADIVSAQRLVGATASLSIDGHVISVAAGLADREEGTPMRPDDRMLAGSVGKMFVAVIALQLVEQGRLDLDAPVSRWLGGEPWFARVPNAERLTLRHLLAHRGGVPNHVNDPRFLAAVAQASRDSAALHRAVSPEEAISFILDRPPAFEPGAGYLYTDTGYLLLGLVIERSIGGTFYEEVSRRILGPMQLAATTPSDRPELPGLVPGYMAPGNDLRLPEKLAYGGRLIVNPAVEWTGGGFISNVSDLARWTETLFEEDDWAQIAAIMLSARDSTAASSGYGFGVSIRQTADGTAYGHSGWFPGYRTEVAYFPERCLSIAFQTNTDRADGGAAVRALVRALESTMRPAGLVTGARRCAPSRSPS